MKPDESSAGRVRSIVPSPAASRRVPPGASVSSSQSISAPDLQRFWAYRLFFGNTVAVSTPGVNIAWVRRQSYGWECDLNEPAREGRSGRIGVGSVLPILCREDWRTNAVPRAVSDTSRKSDMMSERTIESIRSWFIAVCADRRPARRGGEPDFKWPLGMFCPVVMTYRAQEPLINGIMDLVDQLPRRLPGRLDGRGRWLRRRWRVVRAPSGRRSLLAAGRHCWWLRPRQPRLPLLLLSIRPTFPAVDQAFPPPTVVFGSTSAGLVHLPHTWASGIPRATDPAVLPVALKVRTAGGGWWWSGVRPAGRLQPCRRRCRGDGTRRIPDGCPSGRKDKVSGTLPHRGSMSHIQIFGPRSVGIEHRLSTMDLSAHSATSPSASRP